MIGDLAALAKDERSRLGEPPTVEQLVALRDGELPEAEADRLRARLAVDPERAALYLELKRFAQGSGPGEATPGFDTDADVDEAWRELVPKLGQGDPSDTDSGQGDSFPPSSFGTGDPGTGGDVGGGLGHRLADGGRRPLHPAR